MTPLTDNDDRNNYDDEEIIIQNPGYEGGKQYWLRLF